ncbi:MAG TPA: GNAT family N-acetyltransferase [Saprospiraceae bacterium]|nr:GNAT family N-acetyltransferase [Saprospiraceae bacterium]HQW55782.1 GNAT family N-acetyltransferase [Saprospiraceae bacterium]
MLDKKIDIQPHLHDDLITMHPLGIDDFPALYRVAGDALLWTGHPSSDRYKREVFTNFLQGAIESGGGMVAIDSASGEIVGCTRYYDHEIENNCIKIGYSFVGRAYWGKGYNASMKTLMLDHIFKYVDRVYFHVAASNSISQKAMAKLPASIDGRADIAYFGEKSNSNLIYKLDKREWENFREKNN